MGTCSRPTYCVSTRLLFDDEPLLGLTKWISCCSNVISVDMVWETQARISVWLDYGPCVVSFGLSDSFVRFKPRGMKRLVKIEGKVVHVLKHHPWRCMEKWSISPWILKMGSRWRWLISFTLRAIHLWGKISRCPFVRRLGGLQSTQRWPRERSLTVAGIDPRCSSREVGERLRYRR